MKMTSAFASLRSARTLARIATMGTAMMVAMALRMHSHSAPLALIVRIAAYDALLWSLLRYVATASNF